MMGPCPMTLVGSRGQYLMHCLWTLWGSAVRQGGVRCGCPVGEANAFNYASPFLLHLHARTTTHFLEVTVGGSCMGSPAITTHCAPRVSGTSTAGSVACGQCVGIKSSSVMLPGRGGGGGGLVWLQDGRFEHRQLCCLQFA